MNTGLTVESFASYPSGGRALAISQLDALRRIPAALLPVFLVELKVYDWRFPVEQREIVDRLEFAGSHPEALKGFRGIRLPENLGCGNGLQDPQRLLGQVSAYLWSSMQMDAYRAAADHFVGLYDAAAKPELPAIPRLVMICVGQDAKPPDGPMFAKLRSSGQMQTNVRAEGATDALLHTLRRRSQADGAPYSTWYIDGGSPYPGAAGQGVTSVFYPALAPLNQRILAEIESCIKAGSGPEVLQRDLAELAQQAPSANDPAPDPRLWHFSVSLLTEGSGTQIFSTTFVQWAAREVLRRARPTTLLARFAPRQREKPFNAMVASAESTNDLDPAGSLIDAEMSAYYAYLELMSLPPSDSSAFLVWFEGQSQALVAGPGVPAGTVSHASTTISDLLARVSA